METDLEEPSLTRPEDIIVEITKRSIAVSDEDDNLEGAENEIARKMASFTAPKQFLKEPLRSGEYDDMSGLKKPSKIIENLSGVSATTEYSVEEPLEKEKSEEDSMSIEDILKQIPEGLMLPSLKAAEITKINFACGIEIPEVNEGDWYKANLPRIATSNKGKELLVAAEEIKGNLAKDMFSLICADIDFLVQLREKIIADVVSFFHSFSLSRLANLGSVKEIISKEEQILAWAETDSLETAVRRREYILLNTERCFCENFWKPIDKTSKPVNPHQPLIFRS
ncbi:splicing factor 3B subunit 1 [Dorcoceras hygrometricum]|uniref:Splicing factor 3B subunit 1 n=1 Tax=Dorcoceras hygrometricum TaxID=472368 RepID=A0A2Z7DA73_9LAMI|nr:splicing factor 3B subunit 1 [Dorcoceras hygrometricum]